MCLYGGQSHLLTQTIQFLRSEPVVVALGRLDGAKDVVPHPLEDRVGVDIQHLSYLSHAIETRSTRCFYGASDGGPADSMVGVGVSVAVGVALGVGVGLVVGVGVAGSIVWSWVGVGVSLGDEVAVDMGVEVGVGV